MPNPKILVIDDQRSHLRLIKKMIEKYGWRAITADSAEEARLLLDWGNQFRAIITDLKMPWFNGVEFCKMAKRKYPKIEIYALSGNPDLFDYNELNDAGFDGFYFKPVTFETIENILMAIASGSNDNEAQPSTQT
jgi:two-component system response regulator YesN